MRFYTQQHRFYCGVDLHARTLSLCIYDQAGKVVLEKTVAANGLVFLEAISPFRDDLVVGCECMFCWYWLADLCVDNQIAFVLGHALYMKAIYGAKAKNDKIDADKIARLLRGGNMPIAYVYPKGMRETRDLLRRRSYLVHKRSEVATHIRNTHSQYNLPACTDALSCNASRDAQAIAERFSDASVRQSIAIDLQLLEHFEELILKVEKHLMGTAKIHDPQSYARLQTMPGVGKILGMVLMYELHDIQRFASVGDFLSYARLVRCGHESAGKKQGSGGKKIGNAHLRWAFAEAALLFVVHNERAKTWLQRQTKKRGSKGKALGILAARLARAVYQMLRKEVDFDESRFWGQRSSTTEPRIPTTKGRANVKGKGRSGKSKAGSNGKSKAGTKILETAGR